MKYFVQLASIRIYSLCHCLTGVAMAVCQCRPAGRGGARLTHNHERQYHYVLQSLTLWREISTDMFKLWCLAEEGDSPTCSSYGASRRKAVIWRGLQTFPPLVPAWHRRTLPLLVAAWNADMLDPANRYRLADTGQGLNRIQPAPRTYRAISRIVSQCQQRIGHWVGSAVIHLGDHNVPNAFMFIDKYTQVPRILNPIVLVLEEIPKLYRDPHTRQYIDSLFGGVDGARRAILCGGCCRILSPYWVSAELSVSGRSVYFAATSGPMDRSRLSGVQTSSNMALTDPGRTTSSMLGAALMGASRPPGHGVPRCDDIEAALWVHSRVVSINVVHFLLREIPK